MGELRRSSVSALSVGLTCAVFWLVWGARLPASGTLHKWYWGFVCIVIPVLIAMMAAALRERLEKSAWPMIVGALLGYGAASLVYLIYFGFFELGLIASSTQKQGVISIISAAIVFAPVAIVNWLFGALSGAFFVVSRYFLLHFFPPVATALNERE